MKLTLIAVAALALSAGAYADTFDLGTVAGELPVGNTVFAGSFTDTLSFSVAGPSLVTAVAVNTSYMILPSGPSLGNISFFAASLDGVPLTLSLATTNLGPGIDMVVQKVFLASPIPMFTVGNPHTLTIGGVGDAPSAAYTGSLTVTPVPEPDTYALMLAGLGAIGCLARRRRRSD